ncbi:MAG: ABC transporter ATP-binding protein [Desulfobacteraceae bacterium]|jgi:phospholipid/cholesterol/gamma-HCH transport system ATP-binding protein
MIRVEELYKSFDGGEVLKGVSLRVGEGEILALIGRSGYGKSVLLKHVAGLMKPDQGRVLVDGKELCFLKAKELLLLRNRLGFLFQSGALFDSMTIFDNVAFPLREKSKLSERKIREKVLYELDQVGLIDSEEKYPSQISGGMVKRAALARALVEEPEIMLFDEPTTGLDPVTGQAILKLIDSCHKRLNFSGIIVTHEIPRIFEIVNKVAMLHDGVILFEGTPEEILGSKDPTVRGFLSGGMESSAQDMESGPDFVEALRARKKAPPK